MSDPAERKLGEQPPRYRYPEELTPEEIEQTKRVLNVDGEAYLRWLAGDGPDPCPPESSG
jgi:hypothetical protein